MYMLSFVVVRVINHIMRESHKMCEMEIGRCRKCWRNVVLTKRIDRVHPKMSLRYSKDSVYVMKTFVCKVNVMIENGSNRRASKHWAHTVNYGCFYRWLILLLILLLAVVPSLCVCVWIYMLMMTKKGKHKKCATLCSALHFGASTKRKIARDLRWRKILPHSKSEKLIPKQWHQFGKMRERLVTSQGCDSSVDRMSIFM